MPLVSRQKRIIWIGVSKATHAQECTRSAYCACAKLLPPTNRIIEYYIIKASGLIPIRIARVQIVFSGVFDAIGTTFWVRL